MSRVIVIIFVLVICIIVCLLWVVNYYRDNVIIYKVQCDKNVRELKLVNVVIIDMQMCQCDVVVFDVKYTKELVDVKVENDVLCDDVVVGRRRLYIKVVCQLVCEVIIVFGVDNVVFFRLVDIVERDYFIFRERLIIM